MFAFDHLPEGLGGGATREPYRGWFGAAPPEAGGARLSRLIGGVIMAIRPPNERPKIVPDVPDKGPLSTRPPKIENMPLTSSRALVTRRIH